MKIGVLYNKEKYRSLNIFNKDVISALKKNQNIISYKLSNKQSAKEINDINTLYKKVDYVINLSSKCINFTRGIIKPTIFLGHAWMDHGAGINLYHNNKFFNKEDIITFASTSALKKYKYIYGNGRSVSLLPYFTTVNKKKVSTNEQNALRDKYGIPRDKKIIIYFGRLCPEKNIAEIVKIYKKLDRKDACLVMIGAYSDNSTYGFGENKEKGSYQKEIEALVGMMKDKNIKIITGVDRTSLLKILSFSYISINLTKCYEEDFGLSIIESMKLGLPTICSDWGGLKDLVIHKKTGFLIRTSMKDGYKISLEYNDLLPYLNKVFDNHTIYEELSIQAKKRVEMVYGEKAFINNIDKIIKQTQKTKNSILTPKKWIKKIFDKGLKENNIKDIYINNYKLYNNLYNIYASK